MNGIFSSKAVRTIDTGSYWLKILPREFLLSPFFLLFLTATALWSQEREGYRLLPDQVLITRPEHWEAWESPPGVRLIGEDGSVEPRFLRRSINATLDAGAFEYIDPYVTSDTLQGGISAVGSGRESAPFLLDGDLETYWEPNREADLNNWYVEIDLGRAVIARQIVLRFAEEGLGDPFLKFRVMISDGLRFGQEQRRRFFRVGLVNHPNKEQREFTFDIEPQRPVAEDIEGEVAQFVRIDVLDTDGSRAEEVGVEKYQQLSLEEQGAVDYFRTTVGGREISISQKVYEELPAEERGEIRYYRHEQPRLAEMEVYAIGENIISLTQRQRKREASEGGFDFLFFRIFTDGLFSSWFPMRTYDPVTEENQLRIDLGAKYWLERIDLLSPESPPPAYQVRISDGSLDPSGDLIWDTFEERRNLAGHQRMEERFRQQEVRFVEVRRLEFSRNQEEQGNLSEVQAYGEGYVSEVVMNSPFIRLERPRLFSQLTWEGDMPSGTRIEVRTRSGEEILQIPHYFAITGREIAKSLWELIPKSRRPPVQVEELPGPEWSNWSEVYTESGEFFKSPTPRPFALAQVRLLSREPLRAARIRNLRLRFGPPLVDKVVGEIWPVWQVEPGVEQEFTLYMRAEFAAGNPGFDRLRLRSSSAAPIELISVRAGRESQLRLGSARQLWPGTLALEQGEEGAAELVFADPVVRSGETYAIRFRTKVFLQSTVFTTELERETRPGVVQAISPGDASSLVASQELVVVSELRDTRLLDEVVVEPPLFTPNGDGINDETTIRLSVFHLEGEKALRVELFDLSGRRVRELSVQRLHPSGEHRIRWDGRGDDGRLLPPGIYGVRVHLATDIGAAGATVVKLVHVAY